MPVYHRDDAALFARAVESVYANSLPPDEFVLVIDGPVPEAIGDVVGAAQRVHGIRVAQLERNVGLARALNEGLKLVRTEWIARADADDLNVPDRFEKQAAATVTRPLDLLGGAIEEVDREGALLAIRDVPLAPDDIRRRLALRNPFNHMTVAYRTQLARRVGGYPEIDLKEDYGLWAAMLAAGARCANLADVLVRATTGRDMYRRRGGLRHARSEWHMQLHMCRLGQKRLPAALAHGTMRAAVAMLPVSARARLYERLLRTRPPAHGS
jgi:glycosyltransferase involved in cell wall biosynthesis